MTNLSVQFPKVLRRVPRTNFSKVAMNIPLLCFLFLTFFAGAIGSQQVVGATLTVGPGGTYSTIELAYNAAVDGDVILLLPPLPTDTDGYHDEDIIKSFSDALLVNKSVTIDGGGNTIKNDGTGVTAFQFSGNGLTPVLQNVTLCSFNRTGGVGSAITVADMGVAGKVTFNNVTVSESESGNNAVRVESSADFNNCNISNNDKIGLYVFASYRSGSVVNITNTSINCNNSLCAGFGGGLTIDGGFGGGLHTVTVNMTGGSISNNSLGGCNNVAGGGVYYAPHAASLFTVNGTRFVGNVATEASGSTGGGAIYMNDLTGSGAQMQISNAFFESNSSGNGAGAIRINDETTTISNSIFRGNTSPTGVITGGGAVTYTSNLFEANTGGTIPPTGTNTFVNTNAATNTTANFNYPGTLTSACVAGCNPAPAYAQGATISAACTNAGSTLTSTSAGQWYYQQGTTVTAIAGATGTTATIPVALAGQYAIFFQDVPTANGTDPIVGFTVTPAGVTATAGSDQSNILINTAATLAANNTTGTWSIVSGPNTATSQFGNVATYNTSFTPTAAGSYVLRWTVGTPPCDTRDDVTINVTAPLSISGTLLNDPDGLTDGSVDGTLIGAASGTQLYANLVQSGAVVQSVLIPTSGGSVGTYTFANVTAGSYTVVIAQTNTATIPSIPSNWTNVGEAFGTNNTAGTGNEAGSPNGSIAVTIGATDVTGVNFGIEQAPTADPITATSQPNPGGTTTVTVPTLTGSDPEDGTYDGISGTNDIIIQTLPTAAQGILYYNNVAVTAGQPITDYNPALLTVDPANGAVTVTFTYSEVDAAGLVSPAATVSMPFAPISISGNVFNDANGLIGNTVDGTAINGTTLVTYANLVSGGNVVQSVQVSATGTYTFPNVSANTTYTVILTTTAQTVGNALSTAVIPAGYTSTGQNIGAGAGNDGTPANGQITVAVTTNSVTNVNFGIEQAPTANNVNATQQLNPGGTTTVTVPTLTGSDPEDGTYDGISLTNDIIIQSLPTAAQGILYYNNVAVTAGQPITDYNPALLTVDPANGAVTVTFTYSQVDAAGLVSPAATVNIPFAPISISGNVFNDANGLIGNTVDGTPINGTTLVTYANLVTANNVVLSVQVSAAGTYTFPDVSANTTYTVILTTTPQTVGNALSTAVIPAGYTSTGQNIGAGAGNDGTPANGQITVAVTTSSVTNVNFGIEQAPTADPITAAPQLNPGGTTTVEVPTLTGSDPEDGTYDGTSGNDIIIATLPTNGTLYYNGVAITTPNFVINNYNPTFLTVDPANGVVTVTFTYSQVDAAGLVSPAANVSMPFVLENPAIAIIKGSLLDLGLDGVASVGDIITYTYTVKNTGDVTLTSVVVTEQDPLFSGTGILPTPSFVSSPSPEGTLLVGEEATYTATYAITQADINAGFVDNQAQAEGTSPAGTVVDDFSDSNNPADTPNPGSYTENSVTHTPIAQTPAIAIVKGSDLYLGGNGVVNPGDVITYTYTVTNTGNVPLTNVSIDEQETSFTGTFADLSSVNYEANSSTQGSAVGTLLVGESATYTATYAITAADITAGFVDNQAQASGNPPTGSPVTDLSDSSNSGDTNETGTQSDPNGSDPTNTPMPAPCNAKTGTWIH
jgi:hypothetical protein